jgi:DNA-binding response OmpR family regulator
MAKRTALIIDDEDQIRRVTRHALADDFPHIIEAASGAEGLDLAAAEKPELVVLDLMLPNTSGLEVCVELRKWSPAAILVLSAKYADQEPDRHRENHTQVVTKKLHIKPLRAINSPRCRAQYLKAYCIFTAS